MNKITEPNWDSLGDKELQSIIRSRTGEEVNPGRMNHADLVRKAQHAFRNGATETKPVVEPVQATASKATDTRPKSGSHDTAELAGSAAGDPSIDAHPENKAISGKDGKKPAVLKTI